MKEIVAGQGVLESIGSTFGLTRSELVIFLSTAPYRYKVYNIPKRNGKGVREIAQPTKSLKALQKYVLDNFCQSVYPVHSSAMAYVKGISIKDNAHAHKDGEYILKMDFKNFFPSLRDLDLHSHSKIFNEDYSEEMHFVFSNLFFRKRKPSKQYFMSIGAPSSPFLSNTLLYDFDCKVSEHASTWDVTYTRYADDLTFSSSTKDLLFSFPKMVERVLEEILYPKVEINHSKTIFASKKTNRHVTGLVITNDGSVSIGRDKKRYIRGLCFKYSKGLLSWEETEYLQGMLSYVYSVEPKFIDSLNSKYGSELLIRIKKDVRFET